MDPRQALVVAAVAVGLAGCSTGSGPDPARPRSASAEQVSSVSADLDGDGVGEEVRLVDRRIETTLSASGATVSRFVGRSAVLSGVADVDDRQVVALGTSAIGLTEHGRLRPIVLGWFPPSAVWADAAGRLLTGIADPHDATRLAMYHWPSTGTDASPVPMAMHCREDDWPVPRRCGRGTFVGSPEGLPTLLPARDVSDLHVGDRAYAAPLPDGGIVDVRLVPAGSAGAALRVGAARQLLPADADITTVLLRTALEHEGDLVLIAIEAAGDSANYLVFHYDGAALERVPVHGGRRWSLVSGGPAAGGPQTYTWLTTEGRLFTARSEVGVVFYEQVVEWVWAGDRLVARARGPACLDSLGDTDTFGDCGLR